MQTETSAEEIPDGAITIRLRSLGEDINREAQQAESFARDCVVSGVAAVRCALRAGAMLIEAKRIADEGFERWLMRNCPEIKLRTAERWMQLTKASHVTDLTNVKSIRQAYLAVGIIKDKPEEAKGIGTADVDMVASFYTMLTRFEKGIGRMVETVNKVDPADLSAEKRAELIEKTKPMVAYIERVKQVEGA